MAFADLDALYRERITNPQIYRPEILELDLLLGRSPKKTYGIATPPNMTRAWILFGYFNGGSDLECQPIAAAYNSAQHGDIAQEIYTEHNTNGRLSFNGNRTPTRDAWTMYLGYGDSIAEEFVAFQGVASNPNHLFDEKLHAVATATEAGGILEGHTICAQSTDKLEKLIIEAGEIDVLTKRMFRPHVRVPYQATAAAA